MIQSNVDLCDCGCGLYSNKTVYGDYIRLFLRLSVSVSGSVLASVKTAVASFWAPLLVLVQLLVLLLVLLLLLLLLLVLVLVLRHELLHEAPVIGKGNRHCTPSLPRTRVTRAKESLGSWRLHLTTKTSSEGELPDSGEGDAAKDPRKG